MKVKTKSPEEMAKNVGKPGENYISMFDRIVILGILPQPQDEHLVEDDIGVIISLSRRLEPTQAEIVAFKFKVENYALSMTEEGYEPKFDICFTQNEKELIGRCIKKRLDDGVEVDDLQTLLPIFADYIYLDNKKEDGQSTISGE